MKRVKSAILFGFLLASSGMLCTSCADLLDLAPIDHYGSGSYWKNEAHIIGYIDGMHKHLRDAAYQHTFIFGEIRGGAFRDGASADGMGMLYGSLRLQNFDEVNTGVTKFGDLYGRLTNINLFIARVTEATYLAEAAKNYYLGQAHGLRAFYYFDLYRVYGGVPLRLTADVVEGVIDPNKLYLGRSTPKEVMNQIKSDLDKSMEYFGSNNSFDPSNRNNKKAYWSKAATECLIGEVYLWTSKVTTGDDASNAADLSIAKRHLLSVVGNYNLQLLGSFSAVFDAKTGKGNAEEILAIRYAEGEATNQNNIFTYAMTTGSTKDRFLANGDKFLDALNIASTGSQQVEYLLEIYNSFDVKDTRRDATFIASYQKISDELKLYGTHVRKNIGYINAQGARIYCGDYIFYRLPWVYLTLAEIANMEGDGTEVARYVNLVRQRAYANEWSKDQHGYSETSDFTANELTILHEKDKEFIQEGQRWWDLRRMTLTKGGKPLVFCKEGSVKGDAPTLNEATEAHKVLWPIEVTMLNNDPLIYQTPGYKTSKVPQ